MDFCEELPSIFRFLFSVHSEDEVNSRNTAGKMQLISSRSNENEEEDKAKESCQKKKKNCCQTGC